VILGMGEKTLLSQSLCEHISRKEIKLLVNARNPQATSEFSDLWLSSDSLGLSGTLADEWNFFTKCLTAVGFYLGEENDKPLWEGGDTSGKITVKNIYLAHCFYPKFSIFTQLNSENLELADST
jgi:hypothetical protein